MAGLIQTGATYRDRALSGIVAESGLAQKRELASKEFEAKKIEGVGSSIETGIKDIAKIVSAAFGGMGMIPGGDKKPTFEGGVAGDITAAEMGEAATAGAPMAEGRFGPMQ